MDNTLKTFADEVSAYFKKFIITEDSEIQELVYDEKNPIITDEFACLDCRRAFILENDGKIKEIDGAEAPRS